MKKHYLFNNNIFYVEEGTQPTDSVDVSDLSEDIESKASTHSLYITDGEVSWIEKEVELEYSLNEIDYLLAQIDDKSRRPMRAILTALEGTDTSDDLAYLTELESQAEELRQKRSALLT